jgi:hypothetical protein
MIKKYQEYVEGRINEYIKNDERFTCEDLAINLLIDFASENGLPVSFSNESGLILDAGNKAYDNIEAFRNDVLKTTAAEDLMNVTADQSKDNIQKGDLLLHHSEKKERINHTQVVSYTTDDVVMINQGNFVKPGEMILRNSSDPQKWGGLRYIGSKIQRGVYNKETGNYMRSGHRTDELYISKNVIGRRWDFSWFNWKQMIYKK